MNGSDILGGLKRCSSLVSTADRARQPGLYEAHRSQRQQRQRQPLGPVTLEDVVNNINGQIQTANAQPGAQAVGITAQVNQAGDGIELVDTTGAATGTLTAANSDAAK